MTPVKSKENMAVPSFFSDFFSTDFFNDDFVNAPLTKWVPAANVKETPSHYEVELAAPGMKKEDFRVQLEDDVLSIEARKEEEKNETNERFTRREFRTSSFMRSFRLPKSVMNEKIDAKYDNGILKLILPKKEESRQPGPKEVKIS